MQTSVKETSSGPRSLQAEPASRTAIWTFAAAGLLAVFYLVTSIYIAAHRLFWFDELFTLHIARLPGWTTIFTALGHGSDALPPAYYLVVRVFDSLFGPGDVAARLPSAIAMVIGLLVIFDCTRRLTDGLHGLIALSVATCSFLPYYGYEARSYAIYFMLAAMTLWVWTYTGSQQADVGDSVRRGVLRRSLLSLLLRHVSGSLCGVGVAALEARAASVG